MLEAEMHSDPFVQFRGWLEEALKLNLSEPYACTLATAAADGQPSARIVLLRRYDERGLCFFTNYASRKGCELAANPRAALLFYWDDLARQIRIEGLVEKTTAAESDAYFNARPRESRLGAWASPQSDLIKDRAALEELFRAVEERFPGDEVPRPPHWGGYRIVPSSFEFWQGGLHRLHDRLRYTRQADGSWLLQRLAP